MTRILRSVFLLVILMLFVSNVGFKTNMDISYNIGSLVESEYAENLYGDHDADQAARIMSHAVKIADSIYVKDVHGLEETYNGAGSGVVIAVDSKQKKSLVLTNKHVCDMDYEVGKPFDMFNVVTKIERRVVTAHNKKIKMRVLYIDAKNDMCVIETDGIAGIAATIASFYPPIGAKIMTAGAPKGYWKGGLANVVDGRFIGIMTEDLRIGSMVFKEFLQYSLPIAPGMSGSAVYYNGRVIGLINSTATSYGHLGWGPGLKQLDPFVKKTLKRWSNRS